MIEYLRLNDLTTLHLDNFNFTVFMHNAASLILRTRTGLNDLNGGSPSKNSK